MILQNDRDLSDYRDMSNLLKTVVKIGFKPETVIDIGVAYGTPALYENFRNSHLNTSDISAVYQVIKQQYYSYLSGIENVKLIILGTETSFEEDFIYYNTGYIIS